jgi:hypothetical protein
MNDPKDHKTPEASLAAALEWAGRLDGAQYRLMEIRFGQRDPVTVGPDLHYWYATVTMEVSNNLSGIQPSRDTHQQRVAAIVRAWTRFYHPATDSGAPE